MFINVKSASRATGYAQSTIRGFARKNKIQSIKEGRFLSVCLDDIYEYMGSVSLKRRRQWK
jgi:hypothetical protein